MRIEIIRHYGQACPFVNSAQRQADRHRRHAPHRAGSVTAATGQAKRPGLSASTRPTERLRSNSAFKMSIYMSCTTAI